MKSYTASNKRDLLFISHATPEDNEFAKWLALRLAAEGYPVFCEIVDFLGGEDPWKDIEQVIRQRAVKILFVLTNISKDKRGTRKELNLADQIARKESLDDFIIPLKIEAVPHYDVNIELQTTLPISFEDGWAKGLNQLIEKLEQQKVEKNPNFNPNAVTSWWRNHFSADAGLLETPEELLSNWYPISGIPNKIYFHIFQPGVDIECEDMLNEFPYVFYNNGILTFTKIDDFGDNQQLFGDTHYFYIDDLLDDKHNSFISEQDARNKISDLLRQAWEKLLVSRGLKLYELASGSQCGYFVKDQVAGDRLYYDEIDKTEKGKKPYRGIIGFKTINKATGKKRYWHFGISAIPLMRASKYFAVSPHVIFSDDGQEIWLDKDKMHKAKMRQTSNWWNAEWRDRILAVMHYLANEKNEIELIFGSDSIVIVEKTPLRFNSPISFADPVKSSSAESDSVDNIEMEFANENDDIEDEDLEDFDDFEEDDE
jgi:hypothetical protein